MSLNNFSRQRGLSLIELMVGLLLSSILLLGVLQIFDSNRDTLRLQTAFARIQESGRFGMDMLTKEIRIADYWGCAPDSDSIRNHLDKTDADYTPDVLDDLGKKGVLGINGASSLTIGSIAVKEGSDVLYLRGSDDACGGTGRMVPSLTAAALMASQDCNVEEGDVVLLANCQSGELMTITQVQGGGGGNSDKKTLVHNTGNNPVPGRIDNATKTLQREYGADARILVPYSRSFFVGQNVTGGLSLFMRQNFGNAQELIPGIEDMQLLGGRDADNDDVVDVWEPMSMVETDMEQVLAIKVELLVSSDDRVNADDAKLTNIDGLEKEYVDGKLRKVYLSSAKIRNRGNM
ncbi:PilW family protein [Microbulbifer sp.]|uniref:PilW family protein n=1 Tax=Microbulbifer sp. TaxID=1908541 RepID=UPI002F9387BB